MRKMWKEPWDGICNLYCLNLMLQVWLSLERINTLKLIVVILLLENLSYYRGSREESGIKTKAGIF